MGLDELVMLHRPTVVPVPSVTLLYYCDRLCRLHLKSNRSASVQKNTGRETLALKGIQGEGK